MIPIPSNIPPDPEAEAVQSPPIMTMNEAVPSTPIRSMHINLQNAEIDPELVTSFTVVVGPEGDMPEIHTQGDPQTTLKVIALLMNHLASL